MNADSSHKVPISGVTKEASQNDAMQRHAAELSELLKASRELSNILDPQELYTVFAGIILKKFSLRTLALFVYDENNRIFELVFNHGLGDLNVTIKRDGTFPWRIFLENEPVAVEDPLLLEFITQHGLAALQSDVWAPLVMREEVIGLLAMGLQNKNESLDDFDTYFLKQITAHAAVCINTCRLYLKRQKEKEDLDKTLQNLSLLYSIGKAMNYISDLKNLLQYILSQAIEITSAEKGSIMLYDMESDRLKIRVLAGLADEAFQQKVNNNEIECRSFKPGEGIAGRVFLTAKPMVVNNIMKDAQFVGSENSYVRSIVCIPMVVFSDVIGVINVTNKRDGKNFSDEDLEMLKAVADQAAVAVNKAQLWDMAVTDSLTGLFVRRYFMVKFQEELIRAERYNKKLSIVMADLDKFKNINDTYGHDVGDRVLQALGKFFQQNIREVDIVARYGGEEFVIMIPEAGKEAAFCLSERLRRKLEKTRFGDLPPVTISLGVATYPVDGGDVEELIKKADAAMYAAKQAGRNRAEKYTPGIKLIRTNNPPN